MEHREQRKLVELQTKHLARMIAASTPYEGEGVSPLVTYAEEISFDTEEERKLAESLHKPEDDLQIGGFERISQFMSATR